MTWTIRLGGFAGAFAASVPIALHINAIHILDGRQLAVAVMALLASTAISVNGRGIAAALRNL